MSQQDAFAEAVLLFEGDDIGTELHYSEFEALLNQKSAIESLANTNARCAYVVIGSALAVRGLVCFMLRFDANGKADREFSVPLRHLVRHAGPGPDVGCGTIRLACRSQCSVSWHALNLWEPEGEGEANPIRAVQRAVWRNRLGVTLRGQPDLLPPEDEAQAFREPVVQHETERRITPRMVDERVGVQQLIRQHSEQLDGLARKYRADIEQQQQIYLDQIRSCRDEIQRLKSALRQEQSRNRRLQQLLRGEVRE